MLFKKEKKNKKCGSQTTANCSTSPKANTQN